MSIGSQISDMLGAIFENKAPERSLARQFVPTKDLCEKDSIVIDMLNSEGHEDVCYCICDPALADNPIIFASDGFCTLTGYEFAEIEGRNCRFLQGPNTKKDEVDWIRAAVYNQVETSVNLLNYRKDGTTFVNEFFLSPLRNSEKKVRYVRLLVVCFNLFVNIACLTLLFLSYSSLACNAECRKKAQVKRPPIRGKKQACLCNSSTFMSVCLISSLSFNRWVYTQGNHV